MPVLPAKRPWRSAGLQVLRVQDRAGSDVEQLRRELVQRDRIGLVAAGHAAVEHVDAIDGAAVPAVGIRVDRDVGDRPVVEERVHEPAVGRPLDQRRRGEPAVQVGELRVVVQLQAAVAGVGPVAEAVDAGRGPVCAGERARHRRHHDREEDREHDQRPHAAAQLRPDDAAGHVHVTAPRSTP